MKNSFGVAMIAAIGLSGCHPVTSTPTASGGWRYKDSVDAMRGTKIRTALLIGDPPMEGDSGSVLAVIRKDNSTQVMLMNIKFQYLCDGVRFSQVAVKFDSDSVKQYSCSEPQSGSDIAEQIRPADQFLAEMSHAKKLTIESEVYQRGAVQQTFNVSGLNPKF